MPGSGRDPVVTYTLLAINALVWLAATAFGGTDDSQNLLNFGAMFGPLIANGQYWRLFTAIFLHIGVLHILFNSFALFIFGRIVERFYGPSRFIVIYFLAGLAGSVTSYLMNSIALAAGASGAIFGVLGALTAFFFIQRNTLGDMARRNLYSLLMLAGLNLYIGLTFPGVDNWAHLGGFVAGSLIGLALAPTYRPARNPLGYPIGVRDTNSMTRRWWVFPITLVVLIAGTSLATATLPDNAMTHVYAAERLLDDGRYDDAMARLEQAMGLNSEPEAYYLMGRAQGELGNNVLAAAYLRQAISLARRTGDSGTEDDARNLLDQLRP